MGKMPVEPILFLLFAALAMGATLVWLTRSRSGNAVQFLVYTAPVGLILMVWAASLSARNSGNEVSELGLAVLAIPYVIGFFVIDRKLREREGLVFTPAAMPAFQEVGASGRGCDRTLMRLFGSAHRCLIVTVTEDELWIRPFPPFMPVARLGGLIHRVPLLKIHQMERLVGRGANVRLEYSGSDDWCRCVELQLRNPTAFVEAIREGQLEAAA